MSERGGCRTHRSQVFHTALVEFVILIVLQCAQCTLFRGCSCWAGVFFSVSFVEQPLGWTAPTTSKGVRARAHTARNGNSIKNNAEHCARYSRWEANPSTHPPKQPPSRRCCVCVCVDAQSVRRPGRSVRTYMLSSTWLARKRGGFKMYRVARGGHVAPVAMCASSQAACMLYCVRACEHIVCVFVYVCVLDACVDCCQWQAQSGVGSGAIITYFMFFLLY